MCIVISNESIDWNILPNNFKRTFKIPIKKLAPVEAGKILSKMIDQYKVEIPFNGAWKEELHPNNLED